MNPYNEIVDAIMNWIDEKNEEISKRSQSPCIFGVGMPSAIAKVQHRMLCELIDLMIEVGERNKENDHAN